MQYLGHIYTKEKSIILYFLFIKSGMYFSGYPQKMETPKDPMLQPYLCLHCGQGCLVGLVNFKAQQRLAKHNV